MLPKSSWSVLLVAAIACVPALVTCSDDDTSGSGGSGGKGGGSSGTTGGSGAAGGTANAGSGGSAGGSGGGTTSGGSAGSGGSGGSGGSSGTAASGGSGASGGASGTGGAVSDAGPPPPTEAGLSVYSVECSGDSKVCGYPAAQCVSISLGDGSIGYMCSNHCDSNADCSTAPSGAEAQANCVPFTQQSRCALLCNDAGTLHDCPSGMSCYTYPGSLVGYCLWM
jgi:hypothetical protein